MSHGHGAHADHGTASKKVAIFVSFIALFLAIAETLAKGAQTNQISYNVEASNLWAFYQAKTVRQTTLNTAAEQMDIDVALARDPAVKERLEKRVADWRGTAARYQSEPNVKDGVNLGEGRKELQERAIAAAKKRDVYADKYHLYEIASALFQVALVLTSVYLLTSTALLLYCAGGLCAVAFVLTGAGLFSPSLIQLLPH
jgi:hypothetical protein